MPVVYIVEDGAFTPLNKSHVALSDQYNICEVSLVHPKSISGQV